MIKQLIFVAILTVATAIKVTHWKDCGSRDGLVNSININPCLKEPCLLRRGTNVTVAINFTSIVDTRQVTTSVHGILAFVPIPFTAIPKDACVNHNVDHCPLQLGETLTYTNAIYVDPVYPHVRVSVKFEVKDERNRDLVCFIFPTEIVD